MLAKISSQSFYTTPYSHEVWYYNHSNTVLKRCVVTNFYWERAITTLTSIRKLKLTVKLFLTSSIISFRIRRSNLMIRILPGWLRKFKKKLYTVKKKLLKKLNSLQGRRNSIHIISKKRLLFQSKKKIMWYWKKFFKGVPRHVFRTQWNICN